MGCMAAKPIVDRLESDFEGRLTVIRLNIQEPAGRVLGDRYGFKYTPTFVFLDAQGRLLWRTLGAVDPAEVQRSLEGS
jgi:thiol-disulfide isomerase/thioredoxin